MPGVWKYRCRLIAGLAVAGALWAGTELAADLPDVYPVQLPPGGAPSFSTQLSQHPLVEYIERNRIREASVQAPSDPNYGANQYALQLPNVYLTSSTAGTARIKVAVLDAGADFTGTIVMGAPRESLAG